MKHLKTIAVAIILTFVYSKVYGMESAEFVIPSSHQNVRQDSGQLIQQAFVYMRGSGVDKDMPKALEFLEKAKGIDDPHTYFPLALAYKFLPDADSSMKCTTKS